jgi:hypothetical protein
MTSKRMVSVAVLAMFSLALGRAGLLRFQEKERAIRAECQADLKKLGISRDAAKAKYPTPSIGLVTSGCLLPGGTAEVVVKGKFAPGTKFVFGNDNIEVIKESLVGGEYRATVKAAAGTGSQTAALMAITPVSCITARAERAVTIGGKYEWILDAANGWHIVARTPVGRACPAQSGGDDTYDMSFYRKGETNPFEKRKATLYYEPYSATNYRFSISEDDPLVSAGMEDMQTLMKRMMDPNLTDAQRDQVIKRVEQVQQQMQANMQKMSDPSFARQQEAKRKQFGCRSIDLAVQGGAAKGTLRCSEAVGTNIAVTGTLRSLGR